MGVSWWASQTWLRVVVGVSWWAGSAEEYVGNVCMSSAPLFPLMQAYVADLLGDHLEK